MCDCVDRSPPSDATHFHSDNADCNERNCDDDTSLANTELAAGAGVCRENRPSSVRFVPPMRHKEVSGRNERLVCSGSTVCVSVARPVVVQKLARIQSSADKCLTTYSNLKPSDLQCMHRAGGDTGCRDGMLKSSCEVQNVAMKVFNANVISRPEAEESVTAGADECVVKNDSIETSLTVTANDAQPALQQQRCGATLPCDLTVISHSSDVIQRSSQPSYSSNEALEQPVEVSLTSDSVSKQRLVCKDNQLKRIADKSKLASVKASAGSLSVLRNNSHSSRLSLKDAVGVSRPHAYSVLEVAFRFNQIIA